MADEKSKAILRLHAIEERRKSLSRFATRAEIAERDDAIARAAEKVRRPTKRKGRRASYETDSYSWTSPPLTKAFEELKAQELRLYCSIYKLSYTDPVLGLVVPAGMTL